MSRDGGVERVSEKLREWERSREWCRKWCRGRNRDNDIIEGRACNYMEKLVFKYEFIIQIHLGINYKFHFQLNKKSTFLRERLIDK